MKIKFSVSILLCFIFLVGESAQSKTIARLQLRASDRDTWSVTESLFHSFGKGQYLLQIYDREEQLNSSYENERLELYLGSSISWKSSETPFGIVARVQKWSNFDPIYSGGAMLNFNAIPMMVSTLKAWNLTTFLQVFSKNEGEQLGDGELLHYYQASKLFNTKAYVRGYNILYIREEELGGDIVQLFADFIYPLHPRWDIYYRWAYVSVDTAQLGAKGNSSSIGVRFNF